MVRKDETEGIEFYLADGDKKRGVLYLHGWRGGAVFHEKVPNLLNKFHKHGFPVFSAPYRGLLGQSGEYTFYSMIDDAIEYSELLVEKTSADEIVAVGNCIGGLAATAAAAETDLINRVVTMNTLFGFRNEEWWHAEDEYKKRVANWKLIQMGENGPYGTEFKGLSEQFFKEDVCNVENEGAERVVFDERVNELSHKPMLLMASYKDPRIDPLHTWTMYRHLRNEQAREDMEPRASIRVIPKEDPSHTLLLHDDEVQDRVLQWLASD